MQALNKITLLKSRHWLVGGRSATNGQRVVSPINDELCRGCGPVELSMHVKAHGALIVDDVSGPKLQQVWEAALASLLSRVLRQHTLVLLPHSSPVSYSIDR